MGQDNITNNDSDNTANNETNTLINKKSLRDRMRKYSTQLADFDKEDPCARRQKADSRLLGIRLLFRHLGRKACGRSSQTSRQSIFLMLINDVSVRFLMIEMKRRKCENTWLFEAKRLA